jgi:hypothetical protein
MTWNIEEIELKLKESLQKSLSESLYFDTIDYQLYGLSYYEVKKLIEKYAVHMYGDNYKYTNRVWVTVEPDRIKIERR